MGLCSEDGYLIPQVCNLRGVTAHLLYLPDRLRVLRHPAQDLLGYHQQLDALCFCGFSEVCVENPIDGYLVLY